MTSNLTVYSAPSILHRSGPPVRQNEANDTLLRSLAPVFPIAPRSRVTRLPKSLSGSTSNLTRCPKGSCYTLVCLHEKHKDKGDHPKLMITADLRARRSQQRLAATTVGGRRQLTGDKGSPVNPPGIVSATTGKPAAGVMQPRDSKRARPLPDPTLLEALDSDLLVRCASYLDADGLARLGRASAAIGTSQAGQQRSLANEAAHQL
ncbi:hypothetical protein THAOC_10702, partial [Thalassiosira oceanica]